nr:shewanella-like protein phosphatase 1 [Ipomoea batatas]
MTGSSATVALSLIMVKLVFSLWGFASTILLLVETFMMNGRTLVTSAVAYGIERINREVSRWMRGLSDGEDRPEIPFIATRGYDSVVWSRLYSRGNPHIENYQNNQIQSILEETLRAVGAKAMVVGHTPQPMGANCKYNCSIWCIDVGMSSGVLDSMPEVSSMARFAIPVKRQLEKTAEEIYIIAEEVLLFLDGKIIRKLVPLCSHADGGTSILKCMAFSSATTTLHSFRVSSSSVNCPASVTQNSTMAASSLACFPPVPLSKRSRKARRDSTLRSTCLGL